jgi:hypothetical protein
MRDLGRDSEEQGARGVVRGDSDGRVSSGDLIRKAQCAAPPKTNSQKPQGYSTSNHAPASAAVHISQNCSWWEASTWASLARAVALARIAAQS